MNRSVSQTAKALGVNSTQVKEWARLFKEHLSKSANPEKRLPRSFTDDDFLVLSFVHYNWEGSPDLQAIKIGLNRGEHREQPFIHDLYLHTPLLQEPPDELDETWRHGILLNGASINEDLELARNYRRSGDTLLDLAVKERDPFVWACPVLFAYRHTLELYLKIIGEITERTHSLKRCIFLVESHYHKKVGSPVREWILEFDRIDPGSTVFRYSNDHIGSLKGEEVWLDFQQLKFAMDKIFSVIDSAILERLEKGKR